MLRWIYHHRVAFPLLATRWQLVALTLTLACLWCSLSPQLEELSSSMYPCCCLFETNLLMFDAVSFRSELIHIIFPPRHSLTLGALQPEAEPGRLPGDPQDGQRVTWTPAVYCVPHLKVACWRASLTHFHLSVWFFFSLFLTPGLFAVHQRFPDRRIVPRRDWGTFPIISSSVTVCLELIKLVSLD